MDQAAQQVLADPSLSPLEKADLLDERVEPAVSGLIAEWADFAPGAGEVAQAHTVAVAALRTSDLKYRTLIAALRASDQTGLARAAQLAATESRLWTQWVQWQAVLAGE